MEVEHFNKYVWIQEAILVAVATPTTNLKTVEKIHFNANICKCLKYIRIQHENNKNTHKHQHQHNHKSHTIAVIVVAAVALDNNDNNNNNSNTKTIMQNVPQMPFASIFLLSSTLLLLSKHLKIYSLLNKYCPLRILICKAKYQPNIAYDLSMVF